MINFNEKKLLKSYSEKKYQDIIDKISNKLFQNKFSEKEKVFKVNLITINIEYQ